MLPTPSRSWRPHAAAALLALAAGCASSTAPDVAPGAEAGRYVAATANGRALPTVVYASPVDTTVLLADTLVLDGRGGAVRSTARRYVWRGATAGIDTVYRLTWSQAYRVASGGRIEVGSFTPCPPNANCAANEVGVVFSDRVELDTVGNRPRVVLRRAGD